MVVAAGKRGKEVGALQSQSRRVSLSLVLSSDLTFVSCFITRLKKVRQSQFRKTRRAWGRGAGRRENSSQQWRGARWTLAERGYRRRRPAAPAAETSERWTTFDFRSWLFLVRLFSFCNFSRLLLTFLLPSSLSVSHAIRFFFSRSSCVDLGCSVPQTVAN